MPRVRRAAGGVLLQRAISERAIPRLVERTTSPLIRRLGPGIKWSDGWTEAGSAAPGRPVEEKQEEINNADKGGVGKDEPQAPPRPEIWWNAGRTTAWSVVTAGLWGGKQMGMADGTEEESEIENESYGGKGDDGHSSKDENDSSGREGSGRIAGVL
ncbi:MAG: hypothetical protein Q9216_000528 [Gyalolechia sp. 2 TL-2023]